MALNVRLSAEGLTVGRLPPALTGPIALVVAIALVIGILPLVVSDIFILLQLTLFMAYGILAMSLGWVWGYGGIFSFGPGGVLRPRRLHLRRGLHQHGGQHHRALRRGGGACGLRPLPRLLHVLRPHQHGLRGGHHPRGVPDLLQVPGPHGGLRIHHRHRPSRRLQRHAGAPTHQHAGRSHAHDMARGHVPHHRDLPAAGLCRPALRDALQLRPRGRSDERERAPGRAARLRHAALQDGRLRDRRRGGRARRRALRQLELLREPHGVRPRLQRADHHLGGGRRPRHPGRAAGRGHGSGVRHHRARHAADRRREP